MGANWSMRSPGCAEFGFAAFHEFLSLKEKLIDTEDSSSRFTLSRVVFFFFAQPSRRENKPRRPVPCGLSPAGRPEHPRDCRSSRTNSNLHIDLFFFAFLSVGCFVSLLLLLLSGGRDTGPHVKVSISTARWCSKRHGTSTSLQGPYRSSIGRWRELLSHHNVSWSLTLHYLNEMQSPRSVHRRWIDENALARIKMRKSRVDSSNSLEKNNGVVMNGYALMNFKSIP